jgi:3-methyladenine DNA glycosylase Tag
MPIELLSKYIFAKTIVIDEGYSDEISWQSNLRFDDLDENMFLKELAWVVLSSGMKERVVSNLFGKISECFFNWVSVERIVENEDTCFYEATKVFNNKSKISAIINAAHRIKRIGFHQLKKLVSENPIGTLQEFSYIGPVTVYHLAKNIGLPVAKPDRHLTRIANRAGYNEVQEFCNEISRLSGDSISVVDIVLWRFATIERDYLNVLSVVNDNFEALEESYGGLHDKQSFL